MEATGFLDALNSAPVPGIKIKKKKLSATSPVSKAVSPTTNKVLNTLTFCCYVCCYMCIFFLLFIWHKKTPFKRISRPQVISFDGKPSSGAKPSSPDAGVSSMQVDENNEPEQPGTPVPADDPEASDNSEIHFLELLCYTVLFFFFFLFLDLKFKSFVS